MSEAFKFVLPLSALQIEWETQHHATPLFAGDPPIFQWQKGETVITGRIEMAFIKDVEYFRDAYKTLQKESDALHPEIGDCVPIEVRESAEKRMVEVSIKLLDNNSSTQTVTDERGADSAPWLKEEEG